MDAVGLPGGAWIGEGEVLIVWSRVVEEEGVIGAGMCGFDVGFPPVAVVFLERVFILGDLDADFGGVGRP